MHDQQVIECMPRFPDLRRTRQFHPSIIPVDTKLAAGITQFFPQFNDQLKNDWVHIPNHLNATAIDLSMTVKETCKSQ